MSCCRILFRSLKRIISPPGQTPLDPVVMAIIFICNLANAMIITMPFSFLPRMMREFGFEEKEVGFNVGLVASSLFVGRAFGSYIWGWLCDRIGRKKSLLISSSLILVFNLLFGFSKSITWAITSRFFQGAFGGLIIALKATVFALCDETNNSLGMAIVLSSFQIGLVVGPAVGGYLVFPAESYPNTFSKDSIFGRNPFLLPILINVIILAISILMAAFKIPETLKRNSEEANLISNGPGKERRSNSKSQRKFLNMYAYDVSFAKESYTILTVKPDERSAKHSDQFNGDALSVSHFQVPDEQYMHSSNSKPSLKCWKSFKESSLWKLLRIRAVQVSLTIYALFSFITVGFDETFPIFADSSKIYGGLAFTSGDIGTAILIAAAPMVFLVFVIARVFIFTVMVIIVGLPLFPYVASVPDSYVWYALIPSLFIERFAMSTGFLAVNVALNNSADPEYMGLVNGLGMTSSSVFRAISPTILGTLYSWSLKNEGRLGYPFNHFFPFVLCSFIALFTLAIAVCLPDKHPEIDFDVGSQTISEDPTFEDDSRQASTSA